MLKVRAPSNLTLRAEVLTLSILIFIATAKANNSTQDVPINGIASWGSAMIDEQEVEVSIDGEDDDDDDDCFGSLELAYPD